MRLKEDGSLDLDWRDPPPAKTLDQMHEAVIQGLMSRKGFTREEAEEAAENFY